MRMNPKFYIVGMIMLLLFTTANNYSQTLNTCATDFNNDAVTNYDDFNIFKLKFLDDYYHVIPDPTDLDKNKRTNINDFCIFIINYGRRNNAIIFNLSAAIYTPSYIDIPVSISSDNSVNYIYLELHFKSDKFASIIGIVSPKAYIRGSSKINNNLKRICYNGNSLVNIENDIPLLYIRLKSLNQIIETQDIVTVITKINSKSSGYIVK
jgi:hypothetical protein